MRRSTNGRWNEGSCDEALGMHAAIANFAMTWMGFSKPRRLKPVGYRAGGADLVEKEAGDS